MNRIKKLTLFSLFALLSVFFIGINTIKAADILSIENVEITDKSSGTEAIVSIDSGEITNSVTFHSLNEYVTYKITVKNNSGKKIVIKTITDDNSDNQIEYQYDKHETEEIDSNSELDLSVKAVYKSENTDMTNRSLNSKVTLVISYYDEGELKSSSITLNPKTNDNIHLFISLLIVSFIGLTICFLIKSNSKIKKYLVIIGIIVTVPIMAKAASIACSIVFNAGITFEDKVLLTYVIDGQENTIVVPYNSLIEDIEFPCEEGYAPDDWKNEDNSDYDTSKRIKDDIKLYATLKYVAKPTITVTNFDSFSYTAPNAVKYFISEYATVPTYDESNSSSSSSGGIIISPLENLEFWTASNSISELSVKKNRSYYVFAMDSNNNISPNYGEIGTKKVSFTRGNGTAIYINSDCCMLSFVIGGSVPVPNHYECPTLYLLEGSSINLKTELFYGYEDLKIYANEVETGNNRDFLIDKEYNFRANAHGKYSSLTINPNGGEYNGSSGATVITMEKYSRSNNSIAIPVRQGSTFLGWFTDPSGGDMVYKADGNNTGNLDYWGSNESGCSGPCKYWDHDEDLIIYAHWALDKPTITNVTSDTFSYSSNSGVAFYVSSNSTTPAIGPVQDTFELDKWTTATTTTNLPMSNGNNYYVWTIDENGLVSSYNYVVSLQINLQFDDNDTVELRRNNENGELLEVVDNKGYTFKGTNVYIKVTSTDTIENLIMKCYSTDIGLIPIQTINIIDNESIQTINTTSTFSASKN